MQQCCSLTTFASEAYPPQSLQLNNTTPCALTVFVYATFGTGGSCTELMQDLNTTGCVVYPILLKAGTSMTLYNYGSIPGSWWLNGGSISTPSPSTFYYTAAVVGTGYIKWSGSCSPTACNSYSGSVAVGIPCSGYLYTYTVTSSPICCGNGAQWIDGGFPGSNAIVNFY